MTEKDLARIETKLKIALPTAYRQLMLVRSAELEAAGCFNDSLSSFFLDPEEIISVNTLERPKDAGTGYAFPKWWQTFFMVGTNGGGDYYCLRLDNQPGVWLIGSDCGDKPRRVASALEVYVKKRVQEHQEEIQEVVPAEAPHEDILDVIPVEAPLDEVESTGAPTPWDFSWKHPAIDEQALKLRMQALGTGDGDHDPLDDAAALAFADWLAKHGDLEWADYIRICCALDGKTPDEGYPARFERFTEGKFSYRRHGCPEFPGFSLSSGRTYLDEWWGDDRDGLEKGLPSLVRVDSPGGEEHRGGAARLMHGLGRLVATTPVRGVDFAWYYIGHMAAILTSAGARHLRRLAFDSRPSPGETCAVMEALAKAPLTQSLERLDIHSGIQDDANALLLARTPFARLRCLALLAAVPVVCSAKAVVALTGAAWFRKLERLHIGFSEDCCETGMLQLAEMPHLHTLEIWIPPDRQITALSRAKAFPALRRLFIHCANLTGKQREAFVQLQTPQLLELWLRNSKVKRPDMRALAASPLFSNLRVLTLDGTDIDEVGLEALAASPCAAKLRILRLRGAHDGSGSFRSLAATPLCKPGAFPELTTLKLEDPYAKNAPKDTAEFLRKLATPKLRHLKLDSCDVDDECAALLGSSPTFANLSSLHLGAQADRPKPSAKALEKLFQAPNLQGVVSLRIDPLFDAPAVALGKALPVLLDPAVLPNLVNGWFSTKKVPQDILDKLSAARPTIWVSQY